MAEVFISHSSKDKEIAEMVCNALESNGIKCWIAPRDIIGGTGWSASITDAISESKVFIVIYSENSAQSTQVARELSLADDTSKHQRTIIPYKIDDTELVADFKYYLTSSHWVTADRDNNNLNTELLVSAVNKALDNEDAKVVINNVTINNGMYTEKNKTAAAKKKSSFARYIAIGGAVLLALIIAVVVIIAVGNGNSHNGSLPGSLTSGNTDTREPVLELPRYVDELFSQTCEQMYGGDVPYCETAEKSGYASYTMKNEDFILSYEHIKGYGIGKPIALYASVNEIFPDYTYSYELLKKLIAEDAENCYAYSWNYDGERYMLRCAYPLNENYTLVFNVCDEKHKDDTYQLDIMIKQREQENLGAYKKTQEYIIKSQGLSILYIYDLPEKSVNGNMIVNKTKAYGIGSEINGWQYVCYEQGDDMKFGFISADKLTKE
ncbi:MAG: toll/interleukin-1 receptor domain-containing protein [Ruminococcaceae bacterium]|nr:toll/interleukin-1 receptor domain-containing protein [Oscillospiraceae bacterium]